MNEEVQYIYLRFSKAKTFASWLVSTWTGQWPSHCEFVVDHGKYLGSDIDTGVAYVDDEYYKDVEFSRDEYYKIMVTASEKEAIMMHAESMLGKEYDTWALIGNMFRRNWQETKKWFCSELIAYAFDKGGRLLIRDRTNRVTPGDLLLSTLLIQCKKEDIKF